jgi:hypothetical protein
VGAAEKPHPLAEMPQGFLLHRGAVQEFSRGLSELSERYRSDSIPEGLPIFPEVSGPWRAGFERKPQFMERPRHELMRLRDFSRITRPILMALLLLRRGVR